MKLNSKLLKKVLSKVSVTRKDEIGCDECFEQINEFAEMKLKGKSPEEAMPLVQDHLEKCGECREEYHALLNAMKKLK